MLAAFDAVTPVQRAWGGANASAFRAALLAVNGFDETMKYGGEDKELGVRLTNKGVRGQHLRYVASVVHLDHPRGYVDPRAGGGEQGADPRGAPVGADLGRGRHRQGGDGMIGQVINLDRAPERWASISRIAAERGLPVERVPAVDGRDPAALADAAAAPGSGLRPAEIACFESHRRVWRRIAEADASFGLVLEDDVFLAREIAGFLDALAGAAGGIDLVKLNAHPRGMIVGARPLAEVAGRRLMRPAQGTSDSSAYVIARGFAARALSLHDGYRRALDLALFDPGTGAPDRPGGAGGDDPAALRRLPLPRRGGEQDRHPARPDGAARRSVSPLTAVQREAARSWRRRVVPAAQPLLNLLRAP